MKIRVIDYSDWEQYCEDNGIEQGVCQLTDEQFMEIYNSTETDWEFDSLQEFADEFNTDGPYAPTPTNHVIKFFPNE